MVEDALGVCCVHAADAHGFHMAQVVFHQRGEDTLYTAGADDILDVFGLRGVDCANADVVCAIFGCADGFFFGVCGDADDRVGT